MSQPDLVELVELFAGRFESELKTSQTGDSATEKWATLRDTMHRTALATFRRKTLKSHDWFEAKSAEITPVIEAKRTALAGYKRFPSERNLQILRAARRKALANRQTLCQRVLVRAQRNNPESSNYREHQRDVLRITHRSTIRATVSILLGNGPFALCTVWTKSES